MSKLSLLFLERSHLQALALSVLVFTLVSYALLDPQDVNGLDASEGPGFERLLNRLYFVLTTMSSVGYGDLSPKTPKAKVLGMCVMTTILVAQFV